MTLTLLMLLPLLGAVAIATLPGENSELVKKVALGVSLLVASATVVMAWGFDRTATDKQFVESYSWTIFTAILSF